MTQPIPKDFSFAKMKTIVSPLLALFIEVYIDPFGAVKGISQQDYFIPMAQITDRTFLKYFGNRYVDLRSLHKILSLKKSDCACKIDYDGRFQCIYSVKEIEELGIDIDKPIADTSQIPICQTFALSEVPNPDILTETLDEYATLLSKFYYNYTDESDYTITGENLDTFLFDIKENYIHQVFAGGPIITKLMVPRLTGLKEVALKKCVTEKTEVSTGDIMSISYWRYSFLYDELKTAMFTKILDL